MLFTAETGAKVQALDFCETEPEASLNCVAKNLDYQKLVRGVKEKGRKLIVMFTEEECSSCSDWKKFLGETKKSLDADVVVIPISSRHRFNKDARYICNKIRARYKPERLDLNQRTVSSTYKRARDPRSSCLVAPTMFVVDPSASIAKEIDPAIIKYKKGLFLKHFMKSSN